MAQVFVGQVNPPAGIHQSRHGDAYRYQVICCQPRIGQSAGIMIYQ